VFNRQRPGSVLRIHSFINQSECGHSLARQRQGPKLVLHRYFEIAQQEKQLEVVFSLLFNFGPFGVLMTPSSSFRHPGQDPGAMVPLYRFAQQQLEKQN